MPGKTKSIKNPYLPNNLKKFRTELGLKQSDLARALNLDRTSITYYEKGSHEPSITNLYRLAEILKVDMIQLISPLPDTHEDAVAFSRAPSAYKIEPIVQEKFMHLTQTEIDIITTFRQLPEEYCQKIVDMTKEFKEKTLY